ncbi:MAG: nucleotide pyrophosphohydrolase [Betaproteobacteria bacterium]|nr:nucleotide pyrophosphohydrolase [Betaproteobacteria bacterium]
MADAIRELQSSLSRFAQERAWERYHTPRNLAALIATEAGELLAHFRWDEEAITLRREDVEMELADVFLGVLRFAEVAGIDLVDVAQRKLAQNAVKYPRGSDTPPTA